MRQLILAQTSAVARSVLLLLAVAFGASACGPPSAPLATPAPPTVVRPGAPGQPSRTTGVEPPAAVPRYTPADVYFMQGMILHHAQALEMTKLVATNTKDAAIQLMARRIDVSQADELKVMEQWLRKRGEPLTMSMSHDPAGSHDMSMPGMLTSLQLRQLRDARDSAFNRLFLTLMIQHHDGALVMVRDLLATSGAAQEPEIFQFVSHVDADQRAEIARMRSMLQ